MIVCKVMVRQTELAWLAGLLDGEGALCLSRAKQGKHTIYAPVCRIDMTHAVTIDRVELILKQLRLNYRRFCYVRKNKKHKKANIITVNKQFDLTRLLEKLLPYLVTKVEHAKVLLEFVRDRIGADHRNSRNRRGLFHGTYTGKEPRLYARVKQLNKRGNSV